MTLTLEQSYTNICIAVERAEWKRQDHINWELSLKTLEEHLFPKKEVAEDVKSVMDKLA